MLFEGTPEADIIFGTRRSDTVFGNGGTDVITTKGGADTIVARGAINAQGGNDKFFSIDFFRVFGEPSSVTTPNMGRGRDLIVIDGHHENGGGAPRMLFSEVDMGPGRDTLILGTVRGSTSYYLGEGSDTAYIVGDMSGGEVYLGSSKTGESVTPGADSHADEVHYNANSNQTIIRGFGPEDSLTIYNSGLNYRTAIERSDFSGGQHTLTLLDGTKIFIATSFDELLNRDQLKFVDDPLTIKKRVIVAGESKPEKAKFGSPFDDDLRIKNGSIFLAEGDDKGRGTRKDERIHGQDGDDILIGRGGADILRGGAGDDLIKGGNGADLLVSGSGDDLLLGGRGDDRLVLQQFFEDEGRDSLIGGKGSDTFVFRGGISDAPVIVRSGPGRDDLHFEDEVGLVILEDYNSRKDTIYLDYLSGAPNPAYSVESMVLYQKPSEMFFPELPYSGALLTQGNLQLLFVGYEVGEIDEGDFVI